MKKLLFTVCFWLLAATGAGAAIVLENECIARADTNVDELSCTITEPTENNYIIIGGGAFFSSNTNTITVSVPTSVTQAVTHGVATSDARAAIHYKQAGASEGTTVTQDTTASMEQGIWVGEYSGLASSALDVTASEGTDDDITATETTGTTLTTTQADELGVAVWGGNPSTTLPDNRSYTNSYTEENHTSGAGTNDAFLTVATQILTSTGTQESTMSADGTHHWTGVIATFKAEVAGTRRRIGPIIFQ